MLGTFSVLGDAEPLVAIHSGVAEDAKEFAVLVDTKLFAKLSHYQVGFAAQLSSIFRHLFVVAVNIEYDRYELVNLYALSYVTIGFNQKIMQLI